jgi:hypothetical protein
LEVKKVNVETIPNMKRKELFNSFMEGKLALAYDSSIKELVNFSLLRRLQYRYHAT